MSGSSILDAMSSRLLLLDGAMGTMLRHHARGGNSDILTIESPEMLMDIHMQYLEAGSDIISTNTFNATRIGLRPFRAEKSVREINVAAARIARKAANQFSKEGVPRFVAGVMGPTDVALTRIGDSGRRAATFAEISDAYREQTEALVEGGVDFLLLETIYDLESARAAIEGIRRSFSSAGVEFPLILSFTTVDSSGRLSSGEAPGEYLTAFADVHPVSVGYNCSPGPETVAPLLRNVHTISPYPIIYYPSAGLPDEVGNYPLSPDGFAEAMRTVLSSLPNERIVILGGCCGTTPAHISALSAMVKRLDGGDWEVGIMD